MMTALRHVVAAGSNSRTDAYLGNKDAMTWSSLAQQAIRSLLRDRRNSHLIIVAIALIIAVASMTAVATFTDRIKRALSTQASQLLAGDLALTSSRPLPPLYRRRAQAAHLRISENLSLRSMVSAESGLQMVELKAVSDTYPLRGELLIAPAPFAAASRASTGPRPGTVWVESRLLTMLKTVIGAPLRLGTAEFQIAGVLVLEPDRAGDLFSIAPRVMMHLDDIPATDLVLPGSRVQHSLIVAGAAKSVAQFRASLDDNAEVRIITPAEARPEVRSALEHAEQFLSLAALVATTLAGLAILVAAHSFAREQLDSIAIMRTLGASRRILALRYMFEIFLLGLIASSIGAGFGMALEFGLAHVLAGWLQGDLPIASAWPAVFGVGVGTASLAGFALPQLLALRDVPPARVLRRDHGTYLARRRTLLSSGCVAIVLLAPWYAGDPATTGWALLGLGACLVMLLLSARVVLVLLSTLYRRSAHWWRLGLINLIRFPALTSLQICALGLSIMAVMLLGFVRGDLVAGWATSLPPDAPDQFLINIEPEEVASLGDYLHQQGVTVEGFYSMARARLVSINDHLVSPDDYPDPRARRLAEREFNLSAATALKPDNRVTTGRFWQPNDPIDQFSFEVEIANSLGIRLGDTVTYRIAEQLLTGRVTSLREVNWETMQANFFVVAPPALLAPHPATFITSFKLPPGRFEILRDLAHRFPSVTILDVMALLRQVRGVMDKSLAAIQFVFLFTVGAGIVVVYSAVQATQVRRLHDTTVMKTLGGTRKRILALTAVEFLALGTVTGLIGALGASVAAWMLATRVLHIEFHFNPQAFAIGSCLGIFAVVLAGLHTVIRGWHQPTAEVLRGG
ncbi:MAG: FtsX-like permease family protein [Gammaproteobacteria bacterium]|nr:FtsX-like permease family protein [Gammaproteobacteria bacterium]